MNFNNPLQQEIQQGESKTLEFNPGTALATGGSMGGAIGGQVGGQVGGGQITMCAGWSGALFAESERLEAEVKQSWGLGYEL